MYTTIFTIDFFPFLLVVLGIRTLLFKRRLVDSKDCMQLDSLHSIMTICNMQIKTGLALKFQVPEFHTRLIIIVGSRRHPVIIDFACAALHSDLLPAELTVSIRTGNAFVLVEAFFKY